MRSLSVEEFHSPAAGCHAERPCLWSLSTLAWQGNARGTLPNGLKSLEVHSVPCGETCGEAVPMPVLIGDAKKAGGVTFDARRKCDPAPPLSAPHRQLEQPLVLLSEGEAENAAGKSTHAEKAWTATPRRRSLPLETTPACIEAWCGLGTLSFYFVDFYLRLMETSPNLYVAQCFKTG